MCKIQINTEDNLVQADESSVQPMRGPETSH